MKKEGWEYTQECSEATSSCWEDTQGWVTFGQSTVPVPSLTQQML